MTPVIPCSTSNITFIPAAIFNTKKNNSLRCCILRKSTKITLYAQDFILPLSASVRLFPHIRTCGLHHKRRFEIVSATGIDVAVEQPDSPVADEGSGEALEIPSAVKSNEESSIKSKISRPGRKSEMPPVEKEDLVPGATFTGKVRSIQPFGAFIDFGAFTDGLVHVSNLSDSYVKDVGTVVSIGQEVKVRLVEANTETGRISLTMRQSDDISKLKDGPADSDKTRPPRRNTQKSNQRRDEVKKTSKFVKEQDLEGTVKNLTRAGAFISLPEGEEGFLPTSEEADDGISSIMGGSSLEAGQQVNVRVLRISRGQVTLTMKKQEDIGLNSKLQGTVHTATNPFLLAFRKNKDIAAFLDEREKEEDTTKNPEGLSNVPSAVDEKVEEDDMDPQNVVSDVLESVDSAVQSIEEDTVTSSDILASEVSVSSVDRGTDAAPETVEVKSEGESDEAIIDEMQVQTTSAEAEISSPRPVEDEKVEADLDKNSSITSEEQIHTPGEEEDTVVSSVILASEGSVSSVDRVTEAAPETVEVKSEGEPDLAIIDEVQVQIPSAETEISSPPPVEDEKVEADPYKNSSITSEEQIQTPGEEVEVSSFTLVEDAQVETDSDNNNSITSEEQIQAPVEESDTYSLTPVEDEKFKPEPDENSSTTSSNGQIDVSLSQESTSEETQIGENEEKQIDNMTEKDEVQIQIPHMDAENLSATLVAAENVGPTPEKNVSISYSNGQSSAPSPAEITTKAAISPTLVKQLREETGAGMMNCKKALCESGGDIVKAQEYLRKKGLASADKKASRATAEGRIGSYIHDSRIGVLIEVNCETDFVSRGEIFKELVDDLAMQVAACPQVRYLVTEDVPEETVEKEREIEMQKEDLSSKPEQIRSKIVEGRIRKRLGELALLDQPYIKNDKVVVKDFVKQTIATIGENIKVKRFVRFNLGEGLEKKSQDFAAEVAAQTSAKPGPTPGKQQPAAVEAKESDEKPPKATVSAALVKQLREDTGAGMMDCKKALSETGGDLDKAQEYLRKKGLSTADKKSSRLAAEGRIGAYIHDSRIGVLIEVNCETDFVGRSEKFKELVDDLAMQVVACPKVEYVSIEDIPESIVSKEKELEMQREDILSKPENLRGRIVEGRVSKRLGELALVEQPFIKDDSVLVKDLVKQTVAAIGENIKVRRFVRFTLGEASDAKMESEV